jgi:hypothetical protein
MDKNYLFKNLITSFKNIFDTINIKYSPNDSIKINENLNNLLDSLEKIRKKYLYDELLQTALFFFINNNYYYNYLFSYTHYSKEFRIKF